MTRAEMALAILFCAGTAAFAQDRAADEKAIRDIVRRISAGEQTFDFFLPDAVTVVGSMVKPVVRNEKPRYCALGPA